MTLAALTRPNLLPLMLQMGKDSQPKQPGYFFFISPDRGASGKKLEHSYAGGSGSRFGQFDAA
jgi:hypothetical protein